MSIKVKFPDKFQEFMTDVYNRLDNKVLLNIAGEEIFTSIQENFEAGGRPDWKDLTRNTKSLRETEGFHKGSYFKILVRSGGLKNSIFKKIKGNTLYIGTKLKYARTHQEGAKKGSFGTVAVKIKKHERIINGKVVHVRSHIRKQKSPWGDIPARPFMMVQDEDWEIIMDTIKEYLNI